MKGIKFTPSEVLNFTHDLTFEESGRPFSRLEMPSYMCVYSNCFNAYNDTRCLSFFSLPNDNRRVLWVKHSGNKALENLAKYGKKDIKFCEKHFYKSSIIVRGTTKMLVRNSVPIPVPNIYLCTENSMDIECEELLRIQLDTVTILDKNPRTRCRIQTCQSPSTSIDNDSSLFINDDHLSLEGNRPPRGPNIRVYSNRLRNIFSSGSSECSGISEAHFRAPLGKPKFEVEAISCRSRIPRYIFKSPLKKNSNITEKLLEHKINDIFSNKSDPVRTFLLLQLFHKRKSQWKNEERDLFLKFYYKSPVMYKYLIDLGFTLPSVSTIQRWHFNIKFSPGIVQSVLDLLRVKSTSLSKMDKKCILLLDEMAIKPELELNTSNDVIYGFVDHGHLGRKNVIATHALVVMLRGLNSNWKQAIGIYIGNVNGVDLSNIIKYCICQVTSLEFDVLAVNTDQGSNNRNAYRILGATVKQPYFFLNGKQIFLLYDAPHLIKSVRNRLLVADILTPGRVSWKVLEKLFETDSGTIKILYKLTKEHLKPNAFQKLSVKLATQVFSNKVAMAIFAAIANNYFAEADKNTAVNTATFILSMNKVFDNLNSACQYSRNPDKNSISGSSNDILQNLQESSQQISLWRSESKIKIPPCFHGLQQTINGVLGLWSCISGDPGQKYLITSHLNQDPLENNISMFRINRRSYEKNPSAARVCKNLKLICFQNLKSSSLSGYENSDSINLLEH